MPIDLSVLGKEGRQLNKEWKEKVKKHNSYSIKNKFHKERKMNEWNAKLISINNHYRKQLKVIEKAGKQQVKELEKMRKEAAIVKRRLNKEKRKLELSKIAPRKSIRLLKKTKRSRCPNGTRKNKKTGKCEKK